MKNTINIFPLLLLSACELPCSELSRMNDMGKLPEEVISYLPYEDEDAVAFVHPEDSTVLLEVSRETRKQYIFSEDECTKITVAFEINVTTMSSADSGLSIVAWVNNFTEINWYDVGIGDSRFKIPVSDAYTELADRYDSMVINGTLYYDVFRLPRDTAAAESGNAILADTLFFNVDAGILRIRMSDGKDYLLEN